MRRVLAIVGAVMLLLASVGGVAADKAFKETDHVRDAGCFDFATSLGVTEFAGSTSDLYGSDAWLTVWAGEPGNSDIVLDRDYDQPATVVFGAGTVSMTIPLVPAGVATVSGTLTPADTIANEDRLRDGNSWYRASQTGTAFTFDATLTLPGVSGPIAVDPGTCSASDQVQSTFQTDPHATIQSFELRSGQCHVANADGASGDVFFSLDQTDFFIGGTITDASGSSIGFDGDGAPDATGSASFATTEYDPATFETLPTTGSATITAVDTGELYTYTIRGPSGFERVRGTLLDVGGSLETSLGTFSLETCVAIDGDVKRVGPQSNGPKPTGKVPANDLPSGAIAVKPGYKAVVTTRGTQVPSETGYPCMAFVDPFTGESFEVPVVNTLWYKLVGTGASVTVDTAGSDFDTVAAAYVGAPDASASVACVDDVPLQPLGRTIQAAITFTAEAGKTYWIQIGGLDERAFADVHWVGYGNLKVAVR